MDLHEHLRELWINSQRELNDEYLSPCAQSLGEFETFHRAAHDLHKDIPREVFGAEFIAFLDSSWDSIWARG